MKKRLALVLGVVLIVITSVSAFVAIQNYNASSGSVGDKKPFYVGVTYCGNSTVGAEKLIDQVKSYTNLFVLQSGPLQTNLTATTEVCDYAVKADLNIIVYFGSYQSNRNAVNSFLNASQDRWGEHFLGLYYGDEPGGKMLDSQVEMGNITKALGGEVRVNQRNNTFQTDIAFKRSGVIVVNTADFSQAATGNVISTWTTYSLNGTITYQVFGQTVTTLNYQPDGTVQNENGTAITNQGNITKFEPYQQLWDSRPIQTYNQAAAAYVDSQQTTIGWIHNQSSVNVFTSDYGLYWFDYKASYDVVLAQLGWNDNPPQELALVRGAADMQNKSWGAMITWATSAYPSLPSADVMYNELKLSYEDGAKYGVVFNYAPGDNGTGLLQDAHFAALQKFWTNVVQNPKETNNVVAQDVLVLPNSYGWGMRSQNDTIWGIWQPDDKSQQIWTATQSSLSKYGSKLDIVYDDPAYLPAGRYTQVEYWNVTA